MQIRQADLKLINYASIFVIFAGAFAFKGGTVDIYFYYLLVLLLFPLLAIISGLSLHKGFVASIFALFVIGVLKVFLGHNTLMLLIKQVVGISLLAFFFYYLLRANDFDWLKLFAIYMRLAKIVAWIAILQSVAFLFAIEPLYNFSYFIPAHRVDTTAGFIRVSSILVEPSHYVIAMAPAIYLAAHNIFKNKALFISRWNSWTVIATVFLTFSALGYLTLISSIIFLLKNPFSIKKIVITVVFLSGSILFLYNTVDTVKSRIDGLIELFIDNNIHRVNISAFTLFNNYTVTVQNFSRHPLFGTGLGSHQVAFDKYSHKEVFDTKRIDILNNLNREDANSMILRITSEMGLLGITLALLFIRRYRAESGTMHEISWIVNTAILILILVKLARDGNYFNHGFPFFLWVYYCTGKITTTSKTSEDQKATA